MAKVLNISIIGSGWLALPLAHKLSDKGLNVTVSCTTTSKCQLLKSLKFDAYTYLIGNQLPLHILDSDVIVMANTCKDVPAYQSMIQQWSDHIQNSQTKPQFIYTSTTGVYQDNGQNHTENSSALNFNHPTYMIEQALKSLNVNILRLSGLVGPMRNPGRFFRKTQSIRNPDNHVNLVHLDDAIGLIERIIDQNNNDEIINACADSHPTKGKYYSHMAKQLDGTILDTTQETTSSGKTIDNEKSKTVLNYQYQHPDVWDMSF